MPGAPHAWECTVTRAARVVIVGGGIVGAATAHQLTHVHGWSDVVLIDQGPLPYNVGSTSHAPGGVVAVSHNKLLAQMASYTSDLFSTLTDYDDAHRAFQRFGGVELARTPERFEDFVRLDAEMAGWGIPTRLLDPDEVGALLPFVDPAALAGGLFAEKSGLVRGYHAVGDLLRQAEERGLEWLEQTALDGIEVQEGRVKAVTTTNPAQPRIECDTVVIAANVWSPELTRHFGLEIPLMAFEHQYAITPALAEWDHYDPTDVDQEVTFPLVRDLDAAMYYRKHWQALGIGSYAHAPRAVASAEVGPTALRDFTPDDFAAAWELAQELVPLLRTRRPVFETAYNGMFAFSVDGMPIIGESRDVAGLWSANASWITHAGGVAKAVTEWMVEGTTEWDMRSCHLYRFQPHATTRRYLQVVTAKNYRELYELHHPRESISEPRNVRTSALHQRHVEAEAEFTAFAGLELPNWYESNTDLLNRYGERIPRRTDWAAMHWSPIQGAEHLTTRDHAGLFDLSGLSIIEVAGAGACEFLDYLCTNLVDVPVGRVVYTCWLMADGGIKRDLTLARMAGDRYWLFVGEGTLPMDLDWVLRHAPNGVSVRDISAAYSAVGIFGPAARSILSGASPADLGNHAFRYYTGQWIDVGFSSVFAMRISYVGELGWELHIPSESSLDVWDALMDAGHGHGLRPAGLGAMDSLRLEKGYRLWGADIHTEYDVHEAGLGWTAKLDKDDFLGKASTERRKQTGLTRRLCCVTVEHHAATLLGNEPVYADDKVIGHVTTANYGYSLDRYVAFAYLPIEHSSPGTAVEIEYTGVRYAGTVVEEPLFDPKMERMRA